MNSLALLTFCISIYLFSIKILPQFVSALNRNQQAWATSLKARLHDQFIFIETELFIRFLFMIVASGVLFGAFFHSLWVLPVSIVLGATAPFLYHSQIRRRRRKDFELQFTQALPQLISALRAGHTIERALESVANTQSNPLKEEIELVLKEIELGNSLSIAFDKLSYRFPYYELKVVGYAIQISRKVGSNLSDVLTNVLEMTTRQRMLYNRVRTLTAQGRMQAWVAIALPFALCTILQIFFPSYLEPLFSTSLGKGVIAFSFAWLSIGGALIYRISHKGTW